MLRISLKTAWRSARARPLAAAAVVAILALGIGAATAIYSVVDAVVLRPLPVREPGRLVWMWNARVERDRAPFSFLDLRDYRDQNAVLEGLAAFTNWTANLTGTGDPERLEGVRRRPEPPKDEIPQAHFRMVMPDYFGVMGISLIEGREFNDGDRETTRRVAVISRAFADRHWRGRPAVGDHLVVGRETLEIIGVCEDVKQFGLDGDPTADLYVPLRQAPPSQAPFLAARMYWVVRADGDAMAIADEVRRAVRRADGDVASSSLRTLEQILSAAAGSRQFNAGLLEILGLSGLLLSMVGVYGVTAFSVRLRSREIAIRLVCGATPGRVVRQILASELPTIGVGLLAGGAIAMMLSRDIPITVAVGLTLGAVGLLACYAPARRAAAADVTSALHDG